MDTDIPSKTHFVYQRLVKIGSCTLNQWAMDFEGNKKRIIESLKQCAAENANLRIGPELEIPGYGCEDHFLEEDTVSHSWEVLADIITDKGDYTSKMLCDFGMPVIFKGIIFNCRVLVYKKNILMIRPKIAMADDGNYRENRYFTPWTKGYEMQDFLIPDFISKIIKQKTCKFGVGIIKFNDLSYAPEICEELWIPYSPSIDLSMSGCEIIGNSSGSHFQIGKQERRYELIIESSKKNGGVFVYSNLVGCDGGRLYFDGGSFVSLNGKLIAQGNRFIYNEVEVVFGIADLNEVVSYRGGNKSRCSQSLQSDIKIFEVKINENLLGNNKFSVNPFYEISFNEYSYEREMQHAPACWMWDYLRRSGASGFFLPLSGGADSSSVAIMVSLLCRAVFEKIDKGKDQFILHELRKIVGNSEYYPKSAEEIASLIFVTAYLETNQSSAHTKSNSKKLAEEIGSFHVCINIEKIVNAFLETFEETFKMRPKFTCQGGDYNQDIQLQNIQARVRMVLSYMLAGLVPWTQKRKSSFLLVLSSGNLDEMITGYLTKYDCSSGDINPIGSISKCRIKRFLQYCYDELKYKALEGVLKETPSAELRPIEEGKKPQTDEEEIGMTYEELSFMGQLRKDYKKGPYSMFRSLLNIWKDRKPEEILDKVKRFFRKYSINRHKVTTITPSLHCESYSIDDNRYDLRQFLYNTNWSFQFGQMENYLQKSQIIKLN